MNITKLNFAETAPYIRKILKRCQFVAIDFEMTGILASPLLRNSNLDTMQMRYWKIKENTKRFLPIQMGICGFEIQDQNKSILAYPFNIYLQPFHNDRQYDKLFIFSSGAAAFLASHNFDFNKCFYEGVTYLSHEDEMLLKETNRLQDLKMQLREKDQEVTHDMTAFYDTYKDKIKQFFESHERELQIPIQFLKYKIYNYIVTQTRKEYQDQHQFYFQYDDELPFKRNILYIKKGQQPIEDADLEEEDLNYLGLRSIIDQLVNTQTPLIFHNGIIDVFHMYDKFFYSFPEKHQEFKRQFIKLFPYIYDTKHIINTSTLLMNKVNHFSELKNSFQTFKKFDQPKIKIHEQFTDYKLEKDDGESETQAFEHEAGYDALMTGHIFFNIINQLQIKPDIEELKLYQNKVGFSNSFNIQFPLGSVKMPFNMNEQQDLYRDKETKIFYLSQVQKQLIPESLIKEYFLSQYGWHVNLFLSYGQSFEYFMIFQKQEDGKKFRELMQDGQLLINVDKFNIIASEYENYTEQLKRRIKDEIEIGSMGTCLEDDLD